ncbi:methionyl-tRNA formyltransferase [Trifolium repens]|nr:methionyl-tRNA formyltransferase [Trifolium repens]
MIRRLLCVQNQSASSPSLFSSSSTTNNKKKPVVLLGAPQVSTIVLDALLTASASPDSSFEVAAIVTQPAARRDRGKNLPSLPWPTMLLRGDSLLILFSLLNVLETILSSLQDGVKETGVSLAFTVLALDVGPIITTETIQIDDHVKAPDLLELLFHKGSKILIRELSSIFDGSAREKAQPQDDSKATLAPKIGPDESWLFFDQEAFVLHNKVRAFSGWPGSRAKILVVDKNGEKKTLEIKIITTRVCTHESVQFNEADDIAYV